MSGATASKGTTPQPAAADAAHESQELTAPLYVAWQITNECNLACLHCIEESGPGKAYKDELTTEEAYTIIDQLVKAEVPYVSFSGGEPMVRPDFFGMVERITTGGVGLKIETNGHYLTPENCKKLKDLGVKAVQVSLDGATPASFNKMRVHGRYDKALEGIKNLRDAGVPVAYRCYDSLAHAFVAFTGVVPLADVACREVAGLVREGFEGRIKCAL